MAVRLRGSLYVCSLFFFAFLRAQQNPVAIDSFFSCGRSWALPAARSGSPFYRRFVAVQLGGWRPYAVAALLLLLKRRGGRGQRFLLAGAPCWTEGFGARTLLVPTAMQGLGLVGDGLPRRRDAGLTDMGSIPSVSAG